MKDKDFFEYIQQHLSELPSEDKEILIKRATDHGYSFTGEPGARKAETSMLLVEDLKRGSSLNEWLEKQKNDPVMAIAKNEEVQAVLEEISQEKFKRPLNQLNPPEFQGILDSKEEVKKRLAEIFEKEETGASSLRLLKFSPNVDTVNRCLEEMAKKTYKKELTELSAAQFEAVVKLDSSIKSWMEEDMAKRFLTEIKGSIEFHKRTLNKKIETWFQVSIAT